ncbi:hypothetical protein D9756_000191 [Leucocoprinus leucothites]|uniref:NACHT domain-containing protein n=1 Tax=Leucocoprinus leucothites TaxID=201217 RepID=A0A8H5GFA4_9AGAR|nr:hypothetical protein D9756_000191 [Leucoagaricus leucothites]
MQSSTFSERSTAGVFSNSSDFILNLYNSVVGDVHETPDNFLATLARYTIRGAEFDSSERDPPPRCHPGTRKAIVDRIWHWFCNPRRTKRMLWLVGPAGVGKSAIMQTLAELVVGKAILATLFFSVNGRNNAARVIVTLAYRIAVQYPPYREFLRTRLAGDSKLMEKSITAQFSALIVDPFITLGIYKGPHPLIFIIDGLDECKGATEQCLLLGLISYFSISFPDAPLLWVMAGRPEAHITTFLSCKRLLPCYDKEEVVINSTEACQDMERFLRAEFQRIRASNPVIRSLFPQWPTENDFLKLLMAAGGLFAYAATGARFIGDPMYGDPISRFQLVLRLIDASIPLPVPENPASTNHPMAHLRALYRHILSQITPDTLPHTIEILAYVILPYWDCPALAFMCTWLGMAPQVVYRALHHLHSVLSIPSPGDARNEGVIVYHKSFSDFLLDSQLSGIETGTEDDEFYRNAVRGLRILSNIPRTGSDLHQYIVPLWPYIEPASPDLEDDQLFIYTGACDEVAHLSDVLRSGKIPLPTIIHGLMVVNWEYDGSEPDLLPDIFDGNSEISKRLDDEGGFLDVPVKFPDLDIFLPVGPLNLHLYQPHNLPSAQKRRKPLKALETSDSRTQVLLSYLEYAKSHTRRLYKSIHREWLPRVGAL